MMDLDDQTRSVYRFLWLLFQDRREAATKPMKVELERVNNFERPHMRLERTNHRSIVVNEYLVRDECQFAITYYGVDRRDNEKVVSRIKQFIENGGTDKTNLNRIPGWNFGWVFPQPLDIELRAGGTIPVGSHELRVSGIDVCDAESGASDPVVFTTTSGNRSLAFRIPRVPFTHPAFPRYRIYVDGHRQGEVPMPQWGYPEVLLSSFTSSGLAPLEAVTYNVSTGKITNEVAVIWRGMRVTRFSSVIREDQVTRALFQSTITLETILFQERERVQPPTMGSVTMEIGVNETSEIVVEV